MTALRSRCLLLAYSLAWWLALPLVLARLWWRGRQEPGYRRHLFERLGFPPVSRTGVPCLWLHAVSVGETRAAQPLIETLLQTYPQHDLLLTHMTPTGRETGKTLFAQHGARVRQAYLPYDAGALVARFLRVTQPQLCILMETEIWPGVMAACAARQVPVVLLNARLSERSLRRAHRLGRLMRDAAHRLTAVGAQSQADADRIISLGVNPVTVTGSIKFDVSPPPSASAAGATLRAQIRARHVWLCASTRDGEEALLLDALARQPLTADTLLLIVPRHPQRFDQVAALVTERGLTLQRRSQLGSDTVTAQVLLGDSMGEMFAYCAASDLVWMGGSLLRLGGQNPIEPFALGKPVLLGLHTFNFAEVCDEAIAAGAAQRVVDADALVTAVIALLGDPSRRIQMGERAAAFAARHRGATARSMALLAPLVQAVPPVAS
ncbi:MAG: lipid IV(A) 3-deoxy-D-manno-octulosonic acid transferase [Pseudomonadota bacterium]|nr:lipid IV(A) 3-deoxy-D-manno-octulosonic acid transferase [Pseudomonadota bacterium]